MVLPGDFGGYLCTADDAAKRLSTANSSGDATG